MTKSQLMFEHLGEEREALSFINETVDRFYPEDPSDPHPEVAFRKLVGTLAEVNTRNIFRFCQSPIERAFFVALQSTFIISDEGSIFFESVRQKDIRQAQLERRQDIERWLLPYAFYLNLPADARPRSYKEFLRADPDKLENVAADFLAQQAFFNYDLNHHNSLWIALQPKFMDFYGPGKNIRVDALVWVPGNPDVKLIIECDGFDYHNDRKAFTGDRQRDRRLASLGYSVRRYSGSEIVTDLYGVVKDLHAHLHSYRFGWKHAPTWRREFNEKYPDDVLPSAEMIEAWRDWVRGEE